MNKTAIKNFAIEARVSLLQMVRDKAALLGITFDGKNLKIENASEKGSDYEIFTSAGGINTVLSPNQSRQRGNLVKKIKAKGFEQTMEEAAYTWFNRIIAIRFMEVNYYLPSRVRVLSSETPGKNEPDIVTLAPNVEELNLTEAEKEAVIDLKNKNRLDEAFQFLFVKQCNELNKILPELFESTKMGDLDYTELLLAIRYTDANSIVRKLLVIPEDDFKEAVEIIGWLYQYYNTELKDDTFKKLKKNVKITTERIPAATQLFTPDWIVRYMVENTVLRIVNSDLVSSGQWVVDREKFKYYIEGANNQPQNSLTTNNQLLNTINFIDPCMGSGHILVYAFEVFMELYRTQGYSERDAARQILENNIYGLDIDRRAYQLAYFALMMKGRKYDRRFFEKGVKLNVFEIIDNGELTVDNCKWIALDDEGKKLINYLLSSFKNAKSYGSLIKLEKHDYRALKENLLETKSKIPNDLEHDYKESQIDMLCALCDRAELLCKKYQCVVTNPPYMGASGMNETLGNFVKNNYPDSKSDLFACFIERCREMTGTYYAMITQHAWMFLSSYEKLRGKLSENTTLNMAHLGARAFDEIGGEVVQTTAFVNCVEKIDGYKGTYIRLVDFAGEAEKKKEFLSGDNRFSADQKNFAKIPGSPVAYWVSEKELLVFSGQWLGDISLPRQGLITGDNDRFLRFWFEIGINNFSIFSNSDITKWFPINKGGEFRKWYGNQDYVVNWKNNGYEICNFKDSKGKLRSRPQNLDYSFKESISWSLITSGGFSVRYFPDSFMFNVAGISIFPKEDNRNYLLGMLNTKIALSITQIINPTINMNAGDVAKLPIIFPTNPVNGVSPEQIRVTIDSLVEQNIALSKSDWDSFETSWDFITHPFVRIVKETLQQAQGDNSNPWRDFHKFSTINFQLSTIFSQWQSECSERFNTLKANEEELNRIFIEIYGLQEELTPDVAEKDVTVRLADLGRDVRSFVSYSVGCLLGRYSLFADGIAYAGGNLDVNKYGNFGCDSDNIIPVTDEEYFSDDIVSGFVRFVKTVFGEATLEENLKFIADALGTKGDTPRQKIRSYFLNDFYKDHLKIYQKRPIYWMFDSGKENGFKALIYMHRYDKETCARVRTDYLFKQQKYLENAGDLASKIIENPITTASDKKEALTRQAKTTKQLAELKLYDQALSHIANQYIELDLDDGVSVNYEKFQGVVVSRKSHGQKDVAVDLLGKRG